MDIDDIRKRCLKRQVGCVILKDGAVIGQAHNIACPKGFCRRATDQMFTRAETCSGQHAAEVALGEAGDRALGAVVYLSANTCPHCLALLTAANVDEILVIGG